MTRLPPMLGAHARALGLRFVDAGGDWAEYALDFSDAVASAPGEDVVATSAMLTMMDNACGMALRVVTQGDRRGFATLDLRMDYIRRPRAKAGVVGRATCLRLEERVALLTGSVHDGDPQNPIAHLTASFIMTREA